MKVSQLSKISRIIFSIHTLAPLILVALTPYLYAKGAGNLKPEYKRWLERDVLYLISKEEERAFESLSSDEARDQFIKDFWEVRNPTPGAPVNPYKQEIYRRISYANQYFGSPRGADNGWKTDRGRVYIVLGEPQQKAPYYGVAQVKPMEIWFYQNTSPALPPYFYILFYQRDYGDDFRLYSPYFDGPDKLTQSVLQQNDRRAALNVIDKALGREVARTTLSLVPNEPVDLQNATSSLESDLMLAVLKTLPDHPLTKEQIRRNRDLLSSVSHRVIVPGEYLTVLTIPLRDADGNINLHYAMRFLKPADFAIGQSGDKYYYSLEASAQVMDEQKRVLFTQQRTISKYLTEAEFVRIKDHAFGYEGILPLPPGKYVIEFLLSNKLKNTAYRAEGEVLVPNVPVKGFYVSDVIAFSTAGQTTKLAARIPFDLAGVKFTPMLGEELTIVPGQDLKFMFQVWAPPSDPRTHRGEKIAVEYSYGRPGTHGEAKVIRDEFAREQFDANGSLVTGKKIPTADLQSGNYRLVVTVLEPDTKTRVFSSLNFHVAPAPGSPGFDVVDEEYGTDLEKGICEAERAAVYMAQKDINSAIEWYGKAYRKDPSNELIRARLANLYYGKGNFAEVQAMYSRSGVTKQTDDQTILQTAQSFANTGQVQRAIEVLEKALNLKTPSQPFYLALASYYKTEGNLQKAAELQNKGRSLEPQ